MEKKEKLVIIGAGEHGKMMYNFFSSNTKFEIVAFAVEKKYRKRNELYGLPVVDFEEVCLLYPPQHYKLFIAVTYVKLNAERSRLYSIAKKQGYEFANYIDPSSKIDKSAKVGENVAIFENNVIQYHTEIGNNVVMQAGGVIAHSSIIHENVWLAPCVAIAGFVEVGSSCFLGINCTICDSLSIAPGSIVGAGTVVYKSIINKGVYVGNPCHRINDKTDGYF